MKSTIDKQKNEVTFKKALNAEEWEAELQNAYNRTKGRYKVAGFRPGKAPRKLIEAHYGAGVFFEAAVDLCVNRIYGEELKAHPEFEVFGQPDITFDKAGEGEAFAFTMKVTLYPEVTLGEYKGIKLPKIEYNVTDEDVDSRIGAELRQASRTVPADKAAENGDITVIDYVGTVDGAEFEGGKAENHELKLGSGSFIPGFEDGLIGAVKGEERDVKVKFPDEYHAENLKGKDAVFHVTVKDVMVEQVPELTDEFVKERGRYESVEEYKAATRKLLEDNAKARERNDKIDSIMRVVTDNAQCEVPEKIIEAETDRMFEQFTHQLAQYGINPADYLKYNNSSESEYREQSKGNAERNIKMRQVMRAVIKAENIEVTADEVKQRLRDPNVRAQLDREARQNGGSVEEYAFNDMLTDKFFDFLLASNEFVLDPPAPEAAADKTEKADAKKPAAKKPAAKKPAKKPTDSGENA